MDLMLQNRNMHIQQIKKFEKEPRIPKFQSICIFKIFVIFAIDSIVLRIFEASFQHHQIDEYFHINALNGVKMTS